MGTRFLALACGIGLAWAIASDGALAQSVTVVRGGTRAEPGPSSIEIVRGRTPQSQVTQAQVTQAQITQAAASGLTAAGHASFIVTPGDVAIVNCPEGNGASRVSCRVRIAPPERKRGAF